jgi:hypothetical protein
VVALATLKVVPIASSAKINKQDLPPYGDGSGIDASLIFLTT